MSFFPIISGSIVAYDGLFHNSVPLIGDDSVIVQNMGSEYVFNYSGTSLDIQMNSTNYVTNQEDRVGLVITVNGVFQQAIHRGDDSFYSIALPVGQKRIEIMNGVVIRNFTPEGYKGCKLTGLNLDLSKFSKVKEPQVIEKITFLGDSITQGATSNYFQLNAYSRLFKYTGGKTVCNIGCAGHEVTNYTSTQSRLDKAISYISQSFENVTTTKKLVIALGTNDWGMSSLPAATFGINYAALLDAVIALDPTIQIFCISPIIRNGEDQLMEDYRTEITNVCSTRSQCTDIYGKTLLDLTDLSDGIHPTNAGHVKLYEAVKGTITPP